MNSAYSIFKRPDLIAKGEPFLESGIEAFQAQVHYTPNLAQEINLSRIQRQLIADKGSFDGDTSGLLTSIVNRCDTARQLRCEVRRGSRYVWTQSMSPTITFRAALTGRCFRYLDCFNGGLATKARTVALLPYGADNQITFKAVHLSSNLDRNIKDNQGGCLYEWPVVSNCATCSGKRLVSCKRNPWIAILAVNGGSNPSTLRHWQKPGIGPMAVRKSSPTKGNCREEGEPIPMKHVGSIRTLPAEGKGHSCRTSHRST